MFSTSLAGLALLLAPFLAGARGPTQAPETGAARTDDASSARPAPSAGDSTLRDGDYVLRITTTGAVVKLALPPVEPDPVVLKSLKRRFGDRGILQAKLRGGDANLNVVAAYGSVRPSTSWREVLMGTKIVGAGQFLVGDVACTEHTRELEPPYMDVAWHAFFTMGDTCFDATFSTLAKGETQPFTRAEFESAVKSARYAYVRLGEWTDMPVAVLDRMHEGLSAPGVEGVERLVELSKSAPDAWACALAAVEIGLVTRRDPAERRELAERALAGLPKPEAASKTENFARFTAESALALALRDEGQLDEALAMLARLETGTKDVGPWAVAAVHYDRATVFGKKGEAANAVAALSLSIDADANRRSFAAHEPCFAPISQDKAFLKLLRPPK